VLTTYPQSPDSDKEEINEYNCQLTSTELPVLRTKVGSSSRVKDLLYSTVYTYHTMYLSTCQVEASGGDRGAICDSVQGFENALDEAGKAPFVRANREYR
jgi:hypothetical protein